MFPKTARCTSVLVVAPGLWVTMVYEAKIGFGLTGSTDDLSMKLSAGVFTNELPRPCKGTADIFCYTMEYLAAAITNAAGLDLGRMLGGDQLAGAITWFPFQFSFPAT